MTEKALDADDRLAFMRRAIEVAREGMNDGEKAPFGAVIVRDGRIVAEGCNRVASSSDPTAHAEVVAIRAATAALGSADLSDCDIYASCEPCPMCLGAILLAGLRGLWFAADRHDAAAAGFDDSRLYREIAQPPDRRELDTRRLLESEGRKFLLDREKKS